VNKKCISPGRSFKTPGSAIVDVGFDKPLSCTFAVDAFPPSIKRVEEWCRWQNECGAKVKKTISSD